MAIAARLSHGRAQLCGTAIGIRKEERSRAFWSCCDKSPTDVAGLTHPALRVSALSYSTLMMGSRRTSGLLAKKKTQRADYQPQRQFTPLHQFVDPWRQIYRE